MSNDGGAFDDGAPAEWLVRSIAEAAEQAGIGALVAGEVAHSPRKSEERFRAVVEKIPEAIFMTHERSITYANQAFLDALGLTEQALVGGIDLADLVHPMETARLAEHIAALSSGAAAHAEYRMRVAGGSLLTFEFSAILFDFEEHPRVLWLGRDVTARKQLEGQLLQTDRLAVLGTLAAGMAHAINNPLSYTLLNLEHVARRMRHISTDRDYYAEARVRLAEAHDGSERVAQIVRQMRTLSRSRPSPPSAVDVRTVLESVLAMVGNEIRHRGQLSLRSDPIPNVFSTESELEQAFLGLLVYVARSLPEERGGRREIRLSTETDESGNAVVVVSDDGPALGDETRNHLFDPFGEGDALGLAMCQAILVSLGGRIDVASGETRGTTFRVVLPAAPAADAVRPRRPSSTTPLPPTTVAARPARVLVIDDDPGVASALRAMLEAHHEVKSVESARDGLQILLGDEDFDVVFCDLVMPDLSGIDIYCALELNRPERVDRLVFMTGGVFTPDAERFLSQVQNPRIEKPFSLNRVEDLLARAVRNHSDPDPAVDATNVTPSA